MASIPQTSEHQWELSKENVQPLKQGREFASLSSALEHNSTDMAKVQTQRNAYEMELRVYSGDDPMSVWEEYISWTEQNFPSGGKDSNLATLLERCVLHFKAEPSLQNDSRYISVWIKLALMSNEPNDIFNYMYNHSIGCQLACFYEAWADVLETAGNPKKADAVFEMGLKAGAQPLHALQRRHSEFQVRVTRMTLQGQLDTPQDEGAAQRKPLGILKSHGKKGTVNSIRPSSSSTARLASTATSSGNRSGPGFAICQDENATPSMLPPQTGEYASVPIASEIQRENTLKAGQWSSARNGKSRPMPHNTPSFKVHEDWGDEQPMVTPRKALLPEGKILSEKKVHHTNILKQFDDAPKMASLDVQQIPMYCKHLIYRGGKEVSFEELRAAKWYARQKEMQEMRQLLKQELMAELRLEMDIDKQTMVTGMANVKLDEPPAAAGHKRPLPHAPHHVPSTKIHSSSSAAASFHQDSGCGKSAHISCSSFSTTDNQNLSPRSDPPSADRSSSLQPSDPPSVNSGSNFSIHKFDPPQSADRNPSTRKFDPPLSADRSVSIHKFDPPQSADSNLSMHRFDPPSVDHSHPPSVDRSSSECSSLQRSIPLSSGSRSLSLMNCGVEETRSNTSQVTPSNYGSLLNMTGSSGGRLPSAEPTPNSSRLNMSSRGSLTAPSPTVNTRLALQTVQNMFNKSILNEFGWNQTHNTSGHNLENEFADDEPAPTSSGGVGLATGGFQIFDENAPSIKQPFQIFDENTGNDKKGLQIYDENAIGNSKPAKDNGLFQKTGLLQKRIPLQARPEVGVDQPAPAPPKTASLPQQEPETHEKMEHQPTSHVEERLQTSCTYVMPMPGLNDEEDLEGDFVDMTFAPNCMSTRIFDPARMAMQTDGAIKNDTTFLPPKTPLASTTVSTSNSHTPGTSLAENQNSVNVTNANGTTAVRDEKYLSPIIETSNEDTRSTTSSSQGSTMGNTMGSITDHHSALSVSHGGQHQTMSSHPMKPMSPIKEPSNEELFEKTNHEIDISAYVPPSPHKELEKSVMINPADPFDELEIAKFLAHLDEPLEYSPNYQQLREPLPLISRDDYLVMGNDEIMVLGEIGEGAFGKVYKVKLTNQDEDFDEIMETKVIKTQKPACPWELYITNEVHQRLATVASSQGLPDVRSSIMYIEKGYFFNDGSCLLYEYCKYGNLLNVANLYKRSGEKVPELFVVYMAVELLAITEAMMKCNMIHGDIKPDNYLFRGLPNLTGVPDEEVFVGPTKSLMLIDFGRSIDLNFYPEGTTFTNKVNTSCFTCIEMMTNRPWTFQTDIFGIAGTVYLLLFLQYMKVYQEGGVWRTSGRFRRAFGASQIWERFFHELLNIPNCKELPNLRALRLDLQGYFLKHRDQYSCKLTDLELRLFKM